MRKIITALLVALLCFSLAGCGNPSNNTESPTNESSTPPQGEKLDPENGNAENYIASFVDAFNANSNTPLEFNENFVPSDKTNGHYRTEFRLGAYKDAIGISYTHGDATVDVVGKNKDTIRIYMTNSSQEQCIEMVRLASPYMSKNISEEVLQDTIDYIAENSSANGYYYADLCLLILGYDNFG